ncbi:MAG: undecaprenyl-diphosphate phosphatase [Verrucomicrobiales bacterium]
MPSWLTALISGLIEGLTEFIPVSSTGHLLIADRWMGSRPEWFTIFIQVGAALALLPLFWKKLTGLVVTWREPASRDYLLKLAAAFVITGVGGLALEKSGLQKLPETVGPVAWATLIGAFIIFGIEAWRKHHPGSPDLTWTIAIACGLAQLLAALFPGTSRSGATIMVALALGLARPVAAEFSFILGMITLTAAGGYKLLGAWRDGEIVETAALDLVLGFLAAAVSAFLVVKWLLRFVQSHTFNGFAIYRALLGAALLVWFQD